MSTTGENRVDFLGIGAQRAATTWLYDKIQQHPDLETPRRTNNKEINFFSNHFVKGYHWYHKQFAFRGNTIGEYSVKYLIDGDAPRRIHRYNPGMKLLVMVRDPVERAVSEHKHKLRGDTAPEGNPSFDEMLPLNPSYLVQGHYARHLKRYLEFFDAEQILIRFFEDVKECPEELVRDLYSFLGVDESFVPGGLETKVNPARTYRSTLLNRLMWDTADLLRSAVSSRLVSALKATGIPGWLRSVNVQPMDSTEVSGPSPELRRSIEEDFKEDVAWLEDFTGRDLSHWFR